MRRNGLVERYVLGLVLDPVQSLPLIRRLLRVLAETRVGTVDFLADWSFMGSGPPATRRWPSLLTAAHSVVADCGAVKEDRTIVR